MLGAGHYKTLLSLISFFLFSAPNFRGRSVDYRQILIMFDGDWNLYKKFSKADRPGQ